MAQIRIHGLIITSPFLAPADELPMAKVWASKILGSLFPKKSMLAEEVDADILTHDAKMREAHRQDELNLTHFTLGWARAAMIAQDTVCNKRLKTLDMPVLYMFADDDKVANPRRNHIFGDQLKAGDKTVIKKAGEYHEILNETDRQVTFETIGSWIVERVGK